MRKELRQQCELDDLVSSNQRLRELFAILPEIAESASTVLSEGESGTGKELLARAIHHLSPRPDKPLVAVNRGALPDTLLESELFGCKAGAFTDAHKDKPGRFATAQGGTPLLDEIGDISPAMQVRLLGVLQERVCEPLGSVTSVTADGRIITATNKDLTELLRTGTFREDLYDRINVVKRAMPLLRGQPQTG